MSDILLSSNESADSCNSVSSEEYEWSFETDNEIENEEIKDIIGM